MEERYTSITSVHSLTLSYKIHISTWKIESTDMELSKAYAGHPKFKMKATEKYLYSATDQLDMRICKQVYTT